MAVEFRGFARMLLRVGGLLYQFGDRIAQRVLGLLAAKQITETAQEGAAMGAHARFQGFGTPMP